jgi:hypothetical protein
MLAARCWWMETPPAAGGGAEVHGVLRLREKRASRTSHSAQDDST